MPLYQQFWLYTKGIFLHFDLGYSYKYNQSVRSLIEERIPKTLVLVGISTVFALIVAIPLGILQVVRRNKPSTTSSPAPRSSATRCPRSCSASC